MTGKIVTELTLRSGDTLTNDRIEKWSYCQLKTDTNTPVYESETSFVLPISEGYKVTI